MHICFSGCSDTDDFSDIFMHMKMREKEWIESGDKKGYREDGQFVINRKKLLQTFAVNSLRFCKKSK